MSSRHFARPLRIAGTSLVAPEATPNPRPVSAGALLHAADKTAYGRLPATGIGEHSAVRRLTVQRRSTQHRHQRPGPPPTQTREDDPGTVRAFHEEARAARIRGGTGIHNALKRRRPRACRFEPCRMHQPHTSRSHSSPTVSARDDRPHCNAAVGATDYHPCRKQGPPRK